MIIKFELFEGRRTTSKKRLRFGGRRFTQYDPIGEENWDDSNEGLNLRKAVIGLGIVGAAALGYKGIQYQQ